VALGAQIEVFEREPEIVGSIEVLEDPDPLGDDLVADAIPGDDRDALHDASDGGGTRYWSGPLRSTASARSQATPRLGPPRCDPLPSAGLRAAAPRGEWALR